MSIIETPSTLLSFLSRRCSSLFNQPDFKRSVLLESDRPAIWQIIEKLRKSLESLQSENATLKKEINTLRSEKDGFSCVTVALQEIHTRDGEDSVTINFPSSDSDEKNVKCSRTLMRQWSPACDALLRHGNSFASDCPSHIELKDVDASTFQIVLDFQCRGYLPTSLPTGKEAEHPVLQFADRFDMQRLKKAYMSAAYEKMPLGIDTIAWHLGLARATNDTEKRKELIGTYFTRGGESFILLNKSTIKQFLELDVRDAAEVLAHDDLAIGHAGRESQVLIWFKDWVAHKTGRAAHAREVWQAVRFELLNVQELLSFQEELTSNMLWTEVAQELGEVLRTALDCKLTENPTQAKKRKATVMTTDETEKNMIRALKIHRTMMTPASIAASGA